MAHLLTEKDLYKLFQDKYLHPTALYCLCLLVLVVLVVSSFDPITFEASFLMKRIYDFITETGKNSIFLNFYFCYCKPQIMNGNI